jgi:two-component system sensor histidine kinase BaeS
MRAGAGGSSLVARLGLWFLAVALISIAVLAGLTAVLAAANVSALAARQRAGAVGAIAVTAAAAWDRNGTWASAKLAPVLDLAARTGSYTEIRDLHGDVAAVSRGFDGQPEQDEAAQAIVVRGRQVGDVAVRFTRPGADLALRTALLRAIAGATGVAALVALLCGLLIARRITVPVMRIIRVTRIRASGDRDVRIGALRGPVEVRELAASIDEMVDTMDRQEQARRALVAEVAHELRTPVAVLQAETEALIDHVEEPTPDQLAVLHDEVLQLGRVLDDLQSLASADAAALHLARRHCDLADVAARAADGMAARFDTASLTLERHLDRADVLADAGRLHQLTSNLLTNALKFTPPGGRVVIETWTAGPAAVLKVTDTGVGIPADEMPRIFDRFWRGQQAAPTSGSGIGLAIAAELAAAHAGRLTAASTPGQGTQLTLTLPAEHQFLLH